MNKYFSGNCAKNAHLKKITLFFGTLFHVLLTCKCPRTQKFSGRKKNSHKCQKKFTKIAVSKQIDAIWLVFWVTFAILGHFSDFLLISAYFGSFCDTPSLLVQGALDPTTFVFVYLTPQKSTFVHWNLTGVKRPWGSPPREVGPWAYLANLAHQKLAPTSVLTKIPIPQRSFQRPIVNFHLEFPVNVRPGGVGGG